MKRKYSISVIVLSTILLLVLAVIPHHYHVELACITDIKKPHNDSCIVESKFIVPSSIEETKYKLPSNSNNTTLLPFVFISSNLSNYVSEFIESKSSNPLYILLYKTVDKDQLHGLRAPPIPLSK